MRILLAAGLIIGSVVLVSSKKPWALHS